ncbi:tryptophan synthase subunit alpha [Fictibacillus iocasae]|uniref:Tryptophan synthase alpha chain n=1 Tax=Fictibacillus iocasae TaxID=2715437 RepID=A0ABW2NLN7_9BACL
MTNARFDHFQAKDGFRFVPYMMGCDPSFEASVEVALALQESGADAIELGVPYSDPLADGPVIQRAAKRCLENNVTLTDVLKLAGEMRRRGITVPVIIFTYYNVLLQLGENQFFKLAEENEVDGVLVPDLPFEESGDLKEECRKRNMALISLVAPTTGEERLKQIAHSAEGFLYCISSMGVTGKRAAFAKNIQPFLENAKRHSDVPVLVGFGISDSEQAMAFEPISDGFIVGSAIVEKIESLCHRLQDKNEAKGAANELKRFLSRLVPPELKKESNHAAENTVDVIKAVSAGKTD